MPSHLHGLNVIQPVHSDSGSQDLLSGPFPDLSLWTHLPFETEDGSNSNENGFSHMAEEVEVEGGTGLGIDSIEAAAIHNGHVNVVTGTNAGNIYLSQQQPSSTSGPSLDLAALLSSFGVNPLAIAQQLQPVQQTAPSLAQLLSRYTQTSETHSSPPLQTQPAQTLPLPPPAKRQRTRKSSVSVGESPADSPTDVSTSTPLTAFEDKRRRNTAASARFRLKKKEREMALETKAKELEIKVNELERECEGLRRENGWLKGLVVGVTGATQSPATGVKRTREEISS